MLFKLAAIGEAIGWTLLIIGIACKQLPYSWNHIPVLVFGQIHGMFFLLYVVAVLLVSPSLGWSLPRTIFAGLCSVPPYGSLAYELVSAHFRKRQHMRQLHSLVQYLVLAI